MKLATLFEDETPFAPGTKVVNTRYIGCRRVRDDKRIHLDAFTEIEFTGATPHYKDPPHSLWDTTFKANGEEYKGLYSTEDFKETFFKGTKREYHKAFLDSLKDNE